VDKNQRGTQLHTPQLGAFAAMLGLSIGGRAMVMASCVEETLMFARLAFTGGPLPANVRARSLKRTHHHSAIGIQNEDYKGGDRCTD
jgi:hypothetical protein